MAKKLIRNNWKQILTAITLLALFAFAYAIREQIFQTVQNLGKVNTFLILLVIPLEVLNYHAQANMYKGTLKVLGHNLKYKTMYRVALEMNFVNAVFPSAGVSGFSYFSVRLKPKGVSAAQATLVQGMKLIMMFISFQVLLFLGLLLLAIDGRASGLLILVAGSLTTLLLVGSLIVAYIIGSKQRINNFFTVITRWINSLIHLVRPKHPETINIDKVKDVFSELHDNYVRLKSNIPQMKKPLLYALLANTIEVAVVYTFYLAFAQVVNPGAVIIAYAVANFAGILSVLPGGVGMYEFLMTAILAAGGVPPSVSLPVTVMYRVVTMSVQLLPGYIFYQRAVHRGSANAT